MSRAFSTLSPGLATGWNALQQTAGIAQIARETGLTRQTVYRIKDDPAGAEAALGRVGLIIPQRETPDNIWVTIIQFSAAVRKRTGLSSPVRAAAKL